jgi:DNA primase
MSTNRVLFLQTGFSTIDLALAYSEVAPFLLPHVCNRPMTFRRYADLWLG